MNSSGGDGAEVIYALRNNSNLANLILDNLEKSGQNVRKVYQQRLPSDTSKDYYFIHRNTGVTQPVIVEYGFLDSTLDDVSQLKNNYEKYAQAVVKAVLEYIGETSTGTYTVQKGDSLYSIANKFNTTVNEIMRLNNLTSNELTIGQKLKIPEQISDEDYEYYVVRNGDTLYSIANRFNLTVDELKRLNNLNTNNLSVGMQLIVSKNEQPVIPSDKDTYIVQKGDSLYSIAQKYNMTVEDLKRLNNLSNNEISIGQVLLVKLEESLPKDEISYTVQSGDNLYSIARKYGVNIDELMNYNNLKTNLLSIGQVIKIPTSNSNVSTVYIVQSGDSLWNIAKKYNTTIDDIKEKNNLTSNLLSIGQRLLI